MKCSVGLPVQSPNINIKLLKILESALSLPYKRTQNIQYKEINLNDSSLSITYINTITQGSAPKSDVVATATVKEGPEPQNQRQMLVTT
jgi:hypothetical protein